MALGSGLLRLLPWYDFCPPPLPPPSIVESFEAIATNIISSENFTNLTSITDDVIFFAGERVSSDFLLSVHVGHFNCLYLFAQARIEDLTDTEVFVKFTATQVGKP